MLAFVCSISFVKHDCMGKIIPTANKDMHGIDCHHCVFQGFMDHHDDIASYFNKKGVSVIFLFRRNTLRRLISVLANDYDRDAKQLNGTHKSHVHSKEEVIFHATVVLCPLLTIFSSYFSH